MRTQTSRSKKPTWQQLLQAKEVTQSPVVDVPPMQAKSNEEGLAEWEAQRQKWAKFGSPWMDKVPNPSGELAQPWIQRKLTIGQPNDKYEKEADRVAKHVVTDINVPGFVNVSQGKPGPYLDRVTDNLQTKPKVSAKQQGQKSIGGTLSANLESAINHARGSGRQLDLGLQQSMGQVMNADFSRVRVHTDAQSDRLSQSIQAKAFTTGQDVFFRNGEYQPHSKRGQALIAHELTHVAQQQGQSVSSSNIQRAIDWQIQDYFFKIGAEPKLGIMKDPDSLYQYLNEWINRIKLWITSIKENKIDANYLQSLEPKVQNDLNRLKPDVETWNEIANNWNSIEPEKIKKYISFLADKSPENLSSKVVTGRIKEFIGRSTAGQRYTYRFYCLEDAFRAILAEDYRKESTEKEVKLADEVLSGNIEEEIKFWIIGFINKLANDAKYLKVKKFMIHAEYKDYFGGKISDVLDKPEKKSISELISALHDATTIFFEMSGVAQQIDNKDFAEDAKDRYKDKYLKTHGLKNEFYNSYKKPDGIPEEVKKYVEVPASKRMASYYINSNINNNNNNNNLQHQENISQVRSGSLNESNSEVLKQLRKNKMLVEIGPSYTTGRLMQLCENFGAEPKTKLAIALAIFAFWNKGYDKAVSGIHRFHFVMDMCKNYLPQLKYENEYPNSISDIWKSL